MWKSAIAYAVLISATVHANGATVPIEPDSFAAGTDLRGAFPGVTLSVEGKVGVEVRAVNGFSPFNGRNLATTGSLVFGQFPFASTEVPQGWDEGLGLLRVDFSRPVDFVKIDLIYDDNDVAALKAFDRYGNFLASFVASGDGRGPTLYSVASITRPTADIAYVLAGGIGGEAIFLDNLQVNAAPIPEPPMIALYGIGLALISRPLRKPGFTQRTD